METRTITRQCGRDAGVVEADITPFCATLAPDGMGRRFAARLAEGARRRRLRKGLNAGVLDPEGQGLPPGTGTPHGGPGSPILAHVFLHDGRALWVEKVVKRHCRGDAGLIRYADEFVGAVAAHAEADRVDTGLGQRREKVGLARSGATTRSIPFSRHRRAGKTSFEWLGFEVRWGKDRQGQAHRKRRTARKKLCPSLTRCTAWGQEHRHLRWPVLFQRLNAKLRGYYNYSGVHGNAAGLKAFFNSARRIRLKWRNRRRQRHRYPGPGDTDVRERVTMARPRIVGRPQTRPATLTTSADLRQRVWLKSPGREHRTPGSGRGPSGHRRSYRDGFSMEPSAKFLACSHCFTDRGLHLDAEQIGIEDAFPCPNCGNTAGRKLPEAGLEALAHRFFVWGSLVRCEYGAAPLIQFNEHQTTSIDVSPWLKRDLELIERLLGVGFFHYGPRLWMVGEVEPLKALQKPKTSTSIVERILREYPARTVGPEEWFYRIRKAPKIPSEPHEYDSPPPDLAGTGRLDTRSLPVLYASPDLQVCVHECRVTAEDELYVATLKPISQLRLLDLSVLLQEDQHVTEFESLDMAVHMLLLAGKHSYKITRSIAAAAHHAGFDGLVYPSYFSLLRIGVMPFQTVFGISHRRIPQLQEYERAKAIPNLAIFGRPIKESKVKVHCINKLILNRVAYEFHFGPVGV